MHHVTINISQNGRHVFRVELGKNGESDGNPSNVKRVFKMLAERFPDCKVTASRRALASRAFNPLLED